jgi:hypothetical protein
MSRTATAGFSFREVGCIAVDVQHHVAGGVADDGGGVGRSIVHQPEALGFGELRGFGLGKAIVPKAASINGSTLKA